MRIAGDAVRWLQLTFLDDWHYATEYVPRDAAYFPPPTEKGDERVQIIGSGPDREIEPILTKAMLASRDAKLLADGTRDLQLHLSDIIGKFLEAQQAQMAQLEEISALKAEIKKMMEKLHEKPGAIPGSSNSQGSKGSPAGKAGSTAPRIISTIDASRSA